jgi:hypothetical protein
MNFNITKTWNGSSVDHPPIQLAFSATENGLNMRVESPFFNDPGNPGGKPGQPFQSLWDYEGIQSINRKCAESFNPSIQYISQALPKND